MMFDESINPSQHYAHKNIATGEGIQRGLFHRLSHSLCNNPTNSVNDVAATPPTQQLAYDLEQLLNTRNIGILNKYENQHFPNASSSVLNFGVGEMLGLSPLNVSDRARMAQRIEYAIQFFEPRLRKVRVSIAALEKHPRQIQFHISAVLKTHSLQAHVQFSAFMDLGSQSIYLKPSP